MRRMMVLVMLLAFAPAVAASAGDAPAPHKRVVHKHVTHKKKRAHHYRSPYGFLPGYEPPEVAERRREREYYETHPYTFYGPAWPRFYHGRWNGGGFGPCYTQTPIGPMWNCGN